MDTLDLVQWPAMIITVAASWYVTSTNRQRRRVGFWLFLASNVMWVIWGIHARAYALIALQACLAILNVRGEWKNAN